MFNIFVFQGVLTVVDVYSEWAGPCNAMANYLKKIKLEVGDELLQCAMANCDSIEALNMFRGHCKPIWLFIIAGQTVEVMHGSNAPLLGRIIQTLMEKLKSGESISQERHNLMHSSNHPQSSAVQKQWC